MGVINIGRVRMGWKGTWDNATPYISQDAVYYLGDTYVARIDVPAGTAPPNTTFWQLVAKKGDTGPAGTDATVNATNVAAAGGVLSDPTDVTGADAVTNIISLTQSEYNAISPPNAATIYIITDA